VELVNIAHALRRRRIIIAFGLAVACALGVLASGVASPHDARAAAPTGSAQAQVLIDTRVPLVATTAPGGAATIVQRSVLLSALMNSDATTAQIARQVRIPADDLTVVVPVLAPVSEFGLVPDGQLPQSVSTASTALHTPYVVQLLPNYNVPVVSIDTSAPDVHGAVALAQATIAAMQSSTLPAATSTPVARPAAIAPPAVVERAAVRGAHHRGRHSLAARRAEQRAIAAARAAQAALAAQAAASPPKPQPTLEVEPLGAITGKALPTTSIHVGRGVAVALGLVAAWLFAIVVAGGLSRVWRRAGQPAAQIAG